MKKSLSLILIFALVVGLCGAALADEVFDFLPAERPAAKDDFYGYTNFDLLNTVEVSEEQMVWSQSANLPSEVSEQLDLILQECVANSGRWTKGSPQQRIAALYLSFIHEDSRDKAGTMYLDPYTERIQSAETIQDYVEVLGAIHAEIGSSSLLSVEPGIGMYDSSEYKLGLDTARTLLNEALILDEAYSNQWDACRIYMTRLFLLSGIRETEAAEKSEAVFNLLQDFQRNALTDSANSMVPMSFEEIDALLPEVDFGAYIESEGLEREDEIIVRDADQLAYIGTLLTEDNLPLLKDYSMAILLNAWADYLSQDFQEIKDAYIATVTGTPAPSLEKSSVECVKSLLEWDFARLYAEKFFPEESKRDVERMTAEIKDWYGQRIAQLDWMSEDAKAAARQKLDAMELKIGYPDNYDFLAWEDEVEFTSPMDEGVLIANCLNFMKARAAHIRSLQGQTLDADTWATATQTVTAYYNHIANELVVPAAILQSIYYDPEASRAHNLGAIGTVIAHEIAHAFDSLGALYDDEGRINTWWADEDFIQYEELQQEVADFFSGIEILPGIHINSAKTLAENIADLGALHCVTGLCGDDSEALQELFTAYAQLYAIKETRYYFSLMYVIDNHAPNLMRVNTVLSNTDAFYRAYGVQEGDGMYVAPANRVGIW